MDSPASCFKFRNSLCFTVRDTGTTVMFLRRVRSSPAGFFRKSLCSRSVWIAETVDSRHTTELVCLHPIFYFPRRNTPNFGGKSSSPLRQCRQQYWGDQASELSLVWRLVVVRARLSRVHSKVMLPQLPGTRPCSNRMRDTLRSPSFRSCVLLYSHMFEVLFMKNISWFLCEPWISL